MKVIEQGLIISDKIRLRWLSWFGNRAARFSEIFGIRHFEIGVSFTLALSAVSSNGWCLVLGIERGSVRKVQGAPRNVQTLIHMIVTNLILEPKKQKFS